jgi:hypothetical protein
MGNIKPESDRTIVTRICEIEGIEYESLALSKYYKELLKKFRFQLLWLANRERIADLIAMLKEKRTIYIMTRTDWNKAETMIQRQISTNIAQLIALKNQQARGGPEVIEALPT